MRILFVSAAISSHTVRWVNALSERGHQVLLVSRGDKKDGLRQIRGDVRIVYLRFAGGVGYYLNVPHLKRIYKKFSPDIVNAHYATGFGTLCRVARVRPLVLSCWGSDIFEFPRLCKKNRKILEKNLAYADAVASTSHTMAHEAARYIKDKPVYVTPFGVDTEKFHPARAGSRQSSRPRPVIGIVKYLKPIYDIQLLIRAFARVCNTTDFHPQLRIYGSGPLKQELRMLANGLGVGDDVLFYETIPNDQVPKVLRSFDIFVNCSKEESFGVAVLEAMSCEVPVIVTRTAGYCEIVQNGRNGIVLKDRKPETMADAIIRLLENDLLRKKYGKAGRARVKQLYDWDENVERMLQLYEHVIRSFQGRRACMD